MLSKIKKLILKVWTFIPFGYLCRFMYGDLRITFYKNGWILIDSGKGTAKDMLPITLVSEQLIQEIENQLKMIGYEA